jgi:2-polyprenyl-3-methyl-5-hydroxy-6-metoxy-1,4-benzoquinol methylase
MTDVMQLEAEAFDSQILQRIEHGHVPDLRNAVECDYFYNNIWRHPEYVRMYYGRAFEKILGYVRRYSRIQPSILEAGCGPGFVCLELAREGFEVTGIDISARCIEVARKTAEAGLLAPNQKTPNYQVHDFLSIRGAYDVVLFWSTLHHFADCDQAVRKARELLNPGGIVVVFEPTRDRVTRNIVSVMYLIEQLLAMTGQYYREPDANLSLDEVRRNIEKEYRLQRYESEDGQKLQSVNDNEAGFEQMLPALKTHFEQLEFEDGNSFYFQIIGGLRMGDMEQNLRMARFIKIMDSLLCEMDLVKPTEFYFVGRKEGKAID